MEVRLTSLAEEKVIILYGLMKEMWFKYCISFIMQCLLFIYEEQVTYLGEHLVTDKNIC